MKICYITSLNAETHHSSFSGYSKLVEYCNFEKQIIDSTKYKNSRIPTIFRKAGNKMNIIPKWYTFQYLEPITLFSNDYNLIHHIYGEDTFFFTPFFKNFGRKKIVVTFHQPPNFFIKLMPSFWRRLAQKADVIIALSTAQRKFFSDNVSTRVEFVPHGINIKSFQNVINLHLENRYYEKICLSVGTWLRDYELLGKTINEIDDKDVMFYIVTSQENEQKLKMIIDRAKHNQLKIFKNISDQELLRLYSISSLFLLPLKDGTINNALLEAMASGLPILATGDYIPQDYIDETCARIVESNPEKISDVIMNLLNTPRELQDMGDKSAEKVKELSWDKVALKVKKIYASLDT